MPQKVKVPIGPNQSADGTRVDFKPVAEPWCEFACEDGTKLKAKLVVSEIVRIDDARTPEGDPVYVIRSSTILHAVVPDELKKAAGPQSGKKSGHYL
jgi:hypothetical protein